MTERKQKPDRLLYNPNQTPEEWADLLLRSVENAGVALITAGLHISRLGNCYTVRTHTTQAGPIIDQGFYNQVRNWLIRYRIENPPTVESERV